ncbi:MAG: AAA family ATPase, partial [Anaerolineaceae bacterium]|nr:AAA family ATPase [Anaerolineaceae bacterium]
MYARIESLFQQETGNRFKILYGAGIEDRFITSNGQFESVEYALLRELQAVRYQRIAFLAPHRPIYFLDEQSKTLSLPSVKQSAPNSPSTFEFEGPIANVNLLREQSQAYSAIERMGTIQSPFERMGDTYAIRMLDSLMKAEDGIQTAIVFLQSESLFRYYEDQRTMAGLIGEWARLGSDHLSLACFVFSASSYEQLANQAHDLPIPEIRSMIQRDDPSGRAVLGQIGVPQQDEIKRLLSLHHVDHCDEDLFIRSILSEGGELKLWHHRFQSVEKLSADLLNQSDWFHIRRGNGISAAQSLEELVGLAEVKGRVKEIAILAKAHHEGRFNASGGYGSLHMIFSGNPGTGKTTVARLMGEILFDHGILKRGHLIEAQASDLVADHVGGTAIKTNQVIDRALDGVLFIDEAYMLSETERGGFGQEAIDTLITRMENDRQRLVVIFAGYPEQMRQFRSSNPGLPRRIPDENILIFPDYHAEELIEIFKQMCAQYQIPTDSTLTTDLIQIFDEMIHTKDHSFGNAGEVRNLFEGMQRKWAIRNYSNPSRSTFSGFKLADLPERYQLMLQSKDQDTKSIDDYFTHLVGLDSIRTVLKEIENRIRFQQLRKDSGFTSEKVRPQHMAFLGNPGTGKTTAARLLGDFYRQKGILRKGHLVEVSRDDLVAGYVGQTAIKTREVIERALGGVLFIDEAYALTEGGGGFGQEAVDILVKAMEDYRDQLLVVFAGYTLEMQQFLRMNSGLTSRIPLKIHFADFSSSELGDIFGQFC